MVAQRISGWFPTTGSSLQLCHSIEPVTVALADGVGETTASPPHAARRVEVTRRVSATQRQLRRWVRVSLMVTRGQLQPLVVPQVMHL